MTIPDPTQIGCGGWTPQKADSQREAERPSNATPCSSSLKLSWLYHFGDLPTEQGLGGVWQTIGVTFSQEQTRSNMWKLRRVMACDDGEKIGEERELPEIILTSYCQRVQFHSLENAPAMAPPETARKSMKPEPNPEAAETAQTTDSQAIVHERLVRHLFADKVVYLYSVKLLRQSRVNPNEQDRHEEFYAAQDIRDVWAGIALELADEAVEVESVTRCVPILSFLLPNASVEARQ